MGDEDPDDDRRRHEHRSEDLENDQPADAIVKGPMLLAAAILTSTESPVGCWFP